MTKFNYYKLSKAKKIRYLKLYQKNRDYIVFLHGFMSDLEGKKPKTFLDFAKKNKLGFLALEYSGHGKSDGIFTDGSILSWFEDALAVLDELTNGKQILIGSSMGGWIALLLAKNRPNRIHSIIGVAAAPDFTEESMWKNFAEDQKKEVLNKGVLYLPSDYGEPYPITRYLIENGRQNLVLREPLELHCPVRLMQGTEDTAVTRETALNLFDHINADDLSLFFKRGADHSFSDQGCLEILEKSLEDILQGC